MTISTYDLGDLKLQSGEILPQAFISYETHGTLNAEKSNVIIYPTWYSGNHEDVRSAIGSDRALNPEKYFIVVPDMFGNGFIIEVCAPFRASGVSVCTCLCWKMGSATRTQPATFLPSIALLHARV